MRFLFLLLTLFLQLNVSGYNLHNPQENHVQNALTSENEDFNERSCILFRYYSPDEGMYISQDPIRLKSGEPAFYAYVHNPNAWVDVFGLEESCDDVDKEFESGASYLITGESYDNYVADADVIGRPDGQFVSPSSAIDRVLSDSRGDISKIEQAMGIPDGAWQDKGGLYRVDVPSPTDHNLRPPTSDMSGANSLFVPGGATSGGIPEAVIDPVPKSQTRINKVIGISV